MSSKQTKDRHVAEAAILVRMTADDRKQIEDAVRILNERHHPDGGRFYLGSFMLASALAKAKEVVAGRTVHVTGKRS